VFSELRGPLQELVGQIMESGKQAPVAILRRHYPAAAQEKVSREAAAKLGFDFEAGRLDTSVHPFCSGLGPGDTRLTTRYDEQFFGDAFFGVLHETGHGLYDQGLPEEHYGTPCGDAASLGIHESQSRLWENFVGRGAAFWRYMLPHVRQAFPNTLDDVTEADWMFAINHVAPSFIRTESDEATYNLHILLRFELEVALMNGDLKPADVPGEWNEKMKTYLRITPPNDAEGCLQDIHWSGGGIGYFPTYTLGNLIAAQLYETAQSAIPSMEEQFAEGEFGSLLGWLKTNIHTHGQRYSPRELVLRATGKPLSARPLLQHLRSKAQLYYGITD